MCLWEDDPVQNAEPQWCGGANSVDLEQARLNYIKVGASQPEFVSKVRVFTPEEMPILLLFGEEHREQVDRQTKIHVLTVLRGMLANHIDLVEGCGYVVAFTGRLGPSAEGSSWAAELPLFLGIASQFDDFPRGSVRQEWQRDALARMDLEQARYVDTIRERVFSEARELEERLKAELSDPSSRVSP